jgi:anthraniloyl-CoA monooxygenase
VATGLAAGAALVAIGQGTALTRRLLGEAVRLDHGAVTMLVEEGTEAGALEDRARTAVLSGRADLVGVLS